ncbi:MAG: thymidine kinase [Planctomycetota bacterium]
MDATHGYLELIIGTMFSGKSTELIRRVNRYEVAGRRVQLFKPSLDDRYGLDHISSHDGLKRGVHFIREPDEILDLLDDQTRVVGIDEIHFFASDVIDVCEGLANLGRTVIASGLLKDFRDEYFPFRSGGKTMADLARTADYVIYLKAICTYQEGDEICGREATRVQRFINGRVAPYDSPTIAVGGKEAYAPRCRQHFVAYGERAKKSRTLPLFPERSDL